VTVKQIAIGRSVRVIDEHCYSNDAIRLRRSVNIREDGVEVPNYADAKAA
jgi:hypothetical protein